MNEQLRWFTEYNQPLYVSLTGITFPDRNYKVCRPNSNITVIEYIYSGEGFIKINGKLTSVSADSIYLLCAGTDHEYFSNPDNPWKKVFINLGGSLAATLPIECGLPQQGLYSGKDMQDIFNKISFFSNNQPGIYDEAALISLFTEAILRLSKKFSVAKKDSDAAELKTYIDTNTNRIVENKELAAHIFRSTDYCIKHFYDEYGITPYNYQLSNKISAAENMLKNTSMPLYEIADALGYSDPQYFSGLFKKKTGLTPREYRKISNSES